MKTDKLRLFLAKSEIKFYKNNNRTYRLINWLQPKIIAKKFNTTTRLVYWLLKKYTIQYNDKLIFIPIIWFYWKNKLWGNRSKYRVIAYKKDLAFHFSSLKKFLRTIRISNMSFWEKLNNLQPIKIKPFDFVIIINIGTNNIAVLSHDKIKIKNSHTNG